METSPPLPPRPRQRVTRSDWWKQLRASNLTPQARLAALTLATWMRADGSGAYPGQETIADACGWANERTARRALTELEKAGYIEIERHAGIRSGEGRSQATHRYWPTIPKTSRSTGRQSPPEHDDQPDTNARQKPVDNHDQPDIDARKNGTTNRTSEHDQPDIDPRSTGHTRPGRVRDRGNQLGGANPASTWDQAANLILGYIRRYHQTDPNRPPLDPQLQKIVDQIPGRLKALRDAPADRARWIVKDAWTATRQNQEA